MNKIHSGTVWNDGRGHDEFLLVIFKYKNRNKQLNGTEMDWTKKKKEDIFNSTNGGQWTNRIDVL